MYARIYMYLHMYVRQNVCRQRSDVCGREGGREEMKGKQKEVIERGSASESRKVRKTENLWHSRIFRRGTGCKKFPLRIRAAFRFWYKLRVPR